MVKCNTCGVDMSSGKSCGHNTTGRVKYGEEAAQRFDPDTFLFCRDCGVMKGGYHHAFCCVEECGTCGAQALSCDCKTEGSG